MLRSIAAVAAGFLVTAILVIATDAVMQRLAPDLFPTPVPGQPIALTTGGVLVNFAYAFAFAIVGGYVMAWIARRAVMRHLAWLLGLLVVFGVASAFMYAGLLPWWYEPLVVILGVIGYYLGARLYLTRHGGMEAVDAK